MAVPKKKTSKSKTKMRRSHHNHKPINVVFNANGVAHLPGQVAPDGTYGGTKVFNTKEEKKPSDEEENQ